MGILSMDSFLFSILRRKKMINYICGSSIPDLVKELNKEKINKEQIIIIQKDKFGTFYAIYEEKE